MGKEQHLEQFVVRQALCPGLHNSLAQAAAMAEIMRPGGSGVLEPGAENLLAKRFDTLFLTSIEQPDQSPGIPGSAELARAPGTADGKDF